MLMYWEVCLSIHPNDLLGKLSLSKASVEQAGNWGLKMKNHESEESPVKPALSQQIERMELESPPMIFSNNTERQAHSAWFSPKFQ